MNTKTLSVESLSPQQAKIWKAVMSNPGKPLYKVAKETGVSINSYYEAKRKLEPKRKYRKQRKSKMQTLIVPPLEESPTPAASASSEKIAVVLISPKQLRSFLASLEGN